jgi:hypothetical protein
MSKAYLFMRVLMTVGAALAAAFVSAQAPVGAERPTPNVGDVWKTRTIDLWNNSELSSAHSELIEARADRLVFRTTVAPSGEVLTLSFTRDLQPCRAMKDSTVEVCAGSLKFPLRVGEKHQFEKLPWANGEGYFSQTCEVKGQESIKVAAGSFDTYRVECTGTLTRVVGNAFTGRVEETLWYAPKAHRAVMTTYTDYRQSGGMFNRRKTELVEYLPK